MPLQPEFVQQFFMVDAASAVHSLHHVPLLYIEAGTDKSVEKYHVARYKEERSTSSAMTRHICLSNSDHEFSDREEQEVVLQETCKWFTG